MARIDWLGTVRVGQLTGSVGPTWQRPVDPEGWPLLTDTTAWGVVGVDLGAPAEHGDGRLYIFFGDVATNQRPGDPPLNSDLVAWTDERSVVRHGGHLPIGWEFVLPFKPTAIGGQDEWRYCLKCAALFWNGDPRFKGVCARGGAHDAFGVGLNFVIPFEPTGVSGQTDWRFCGKCGAMFWNGDQAFTGHCPGGDTHSAIGFRFVMRVASQQPIEGQPRWRFCVNCHGLFWDGYPDKGVCAGAPGGGFRLNAVRRDDGQFDPFRALPPIGCTESLETPNGAFSYGGRMYVFAGIAEQRWSGVRRVGDPAVGQYLFSKADPSTPGPYDTEFLFSPKLGWCAADSSRQSFLGHNVLGFQFVLPHDLPPSSGPRERGWRSCGKCEALFWDGQAGFKGVCQRGGAHEADPGEPADYALEFGAPEDPGNQANWRRCRKCLALFWNGNAPDTGLCPAAGVHEAEGANLRLPHISIEEDAINQRHWRFCRKCFCLFFQGLDNNSGLCARDGGPHEAQGFEFVVPHSTGDSATRQSLWRFCFKCSTMFFDGFPDKGRCPRDGRFHERAGLVFALPHQAPEAFDHQAGWRFCRKCAGLFFDGAHDKGCCPRDGLGHEAAGLNFVLPHNPGADGNNRPKWRFCTRCHGMVRSDQPTWFPWLSPCEVSNADHEILHSQSRAGRGLVMIGFDWNEFRLAWMPLFEGSAPRFDTTRYYHAGKDRWTDWPDSSPGYGLFPHPFPGSYTHVSALWLADPGYWAVVHATAWDAHQRFDTPVVARFSKNLRQWSDPVPLFDPHREQAYGRYMHWPGRDAIYPDNPPSTPGKDQPGWAYGAFLLERYTRFDWARSVLNLSCLLSFSSPYQVQLMQSRVHFPTKVSHTRLFYAGNGTAPAGSTLPLVGTFYGVARNGDLHWYRYNGRGQHDPGGSIGWHPNSGNPIGQGWNGFRHLLGCGDGIILGVLANGDLLWYAYEGSGEDDVTGSTGWHPNSGNPIGNGWHGFRDLIVLPRTGTPSDRLKILAVAENGDLLWYSYEGNGESDITGATGWHPNSGNPIGNGWQGFRHLHGSGNVIFAVQENGDLLWYSYEGNGESDVTGGTGWHPNSGSAIGNGWQGFRHLFGGVTDEEGRGHVIYAVTRDHNVLWYRYDGEGEPDVSGSSGWHPDSGSLIARGP